MTSDWLGGGLIVGLAAVLWLIYLVPTWFRRNEYLATERNVVRLQQTLRILAETAEAPDEVRAEASARSVVEQQRLLKKVTVQNTPPAFLAAAKIRRARAVTSAVLVLALVVAVLGGIQIAVNGAWVVLVVGIVTATLCLTRLRRLARDGRAIKLPVYGSSLTSVSRLNADGSGVFDGADLLSVEGAPDALAAFDALNESAPSGSALAEASADSGWTPVPLPKPLYAGQRRFVAATPVIGYAEQTAQQAEEALLAAAAASERALRAATAPAAVPASASEPAANVAAREEQRSGIPSRFSSMGIVDDTATGSLDVDQVLARRRAG
ncbi:MULTISPECIES: hypothetical protein [Subtercola]|uniref:Large exoprotein n=1 Tax=Subtercola vilae TaxID=2056433 RepID=A0A4T2BRW3_9MICO|nr:MULTISPECIES: hypothetical protein [Subtercola]MEA9986547.1 hypothetical protein [Subtercola sp. RTI3]TIH32048.1 hypothetical protein D4765_16100 [Subtercola vilae]